MSTKSAGLAKKMGYNNVKVMLKGVPGWKKAGNQVVATDSFINKGNIILVDVRSEAEAAKGHIKRAVTIPLAKLNEKELYFPASAPVVVYGGGDQALKAYKMIAKWGRKTVALADGGLGGYVGRGNQLVKGSVKTDIDWIRKLGKGEVGIKDFLSVANDGTGEQIILDVRNPSEMEEGKFVHSVNIPLDSLEGRIAELPKDKEIFIHCSTGARAEMAQAILAKAGCKSRFLVAEVECDGVGNCVVE